MPTFTIPEALQYDLSVYRPDPESPDISDVERERRHKLAELPWKGVIPEPDDYQITEFFGEIADIAYEQNTVEAAWRAEREKIRRQWWDEEHPDGPPYPTGDGAGEVLLAWLSADRQREEFADQRRIQGAAQAAARKRMDAVIAAVCSDHPPAAVVQELPHRALQHFMGWLAGQFSPEAVAAVTS